MPYARQSWRFLAPRIRRGSVVFPPWADDKDRGHLQVASLSIGLWTVRTLVEVDMVKRACTCLTPEDEEQVGTRLLQDTEEESDSRKPGPLV